MPFITLPLVASDGSADTTTIYPNTAQIEDIRAATAGQIAKFPSALTQVTVLYREGTTPRVRTYLTSATTASVLAASNSTFGGGAGADATLVAGTVNVAIPGVTTSSKFLLTRHTAGGTVTSTVEYFYVVSAGQLTITAAVAAGTINTADTSVITYVQVA